VLEWRVRLICLIVVLALVGVAFAAGFSDNEYSDEPGVSDISPLNWEW